MKKLKDILLIEPEEYYHLQSSKYLSSHQIMDFIRSPKLYYLKKTGMIPQTKSSSFAFGSAAHCLLLEGDKEFNKRYAVGGPINPATGKSYGSDTKKFADWQDAQRAERGTNVTFITSEEYFVAKSMSGSIKEHPIASKLFKDGFAERVVRTTFKDLPIQARFDWLSQKDETIVIADLKTCQNLDNFADDAKKYMYDIQAAFYLTALSKTLIDNDLANRDESLAFYFCAVEKVAPFRCGLFHYTAKGIRTTSHIILDAIEDIKQCTESGEWPDGYEDPITLTI